MVIEVFQPQGGQRIASILKCIQAQILRAKHRMCENLNLMWVGFLEMCRWYVTNLGLSRHKKWNVELLVKIQRKVYDIVAKKLLYPIFCVLSTFTTNITEYFYHNETYQMLGCNTRIETIVMITHKSHKWFKVSNRNSKNIRNVTEMVLLTILDSRAITEIKIETIYFPITPQWK